MLSTEPGETWWEAEAGREVGRIRGRRGEGAEGSSTRHGASDAHLTFCTVDVMSEGTLRSLGGGPSPQGWCPCPGGSVSVGMGTGGCHAGIIRDAAKHRKSGERQEGRGRHLDSWPPGCETPGGCGLKSRGSWGLVTASPRDHRSLYAQLRDGPCWGLQCELSFTQTPAAPWPCSRDDGPLLSRPAPSPAPGRHRPVPPAPATMFPPLL